MRPDIVKTAFALLLSAVIAACTPPREAERAPDQPAQERASTPIVVAETERAPAADAPPPAPASKAKKTDASASTYWGIAPGEPVPLKWEDLMPEGAEEELWRQQAEFFEQLSQRYAANTTTLADAGGFSEIEEGSELDLMPQFGTFDVVEDLHGELIRIPGYVVPIDFDQGRHAEFLFVPYMGACIHTPPPPPNQIIFVRAEPAIKIDDIWTPYWLEGELSAEEVRNELGDAAYALTLSELDPYQTR